MILYGYTCPECGGYQPSLRGYRDSAGFLSVRCPVCDEIERIAPHNQQKQQQMGIYQS